jgi:hypothetical protein
VAPVSESALSQGRGFACLLASARNGLDAPVSWLILSPPMGGATMWLIYRIACLIGWHKWWGASGERVCLECGRLLCDSQPAPSTMDHHASS